MTELQTLPEDHTKHREGAAVSSPAPRRPLLRRPWVVPLGLMTLAFVAFSLPPYLTLDPGMSRVSVREDIPWYYALLVTHIVFGSVALLTACLQVWPWLRRNHLAVHRWSGRVYFFAGVLPAGLASLAISPYGEWGLNQRVANTMLALLWLGTSIAGYRAARERRFRQHREWMIRSFALAFAIVSNRVWWAISTMAFAHVVPPSRATIIADPELAAQLFGLSAWLGWVVNLLVAEWWLHRDRLPRSPAPGRAVQAS